MFLFCLIKDIFVHKHRGIWVSFSPIGLPCNRTLVEITSVVGHSSSGFAIYSGRKNPVVLCVIRLGGVEALLLSIFGDSA